jgi:hypothetical protein
MTTTFDIEVVTDCAPHEFVARLFERVNIPVEIEHINGINEITTPNFEISAFGEAADALSQELNIKPNVFIECRPKSSLRTDLLAIKRLLEAVNHWMHALENDFAMIYNGDSVMMYRKDGKLTVNTESEGWTPARMTLITVPYATVRLSPMDETGG